MGAACVPGIYTVEVEGVKPAFLVDSCCSTGFAVNAAQKRRCGQCCHEMRFTFAHPTYRSTTDTYSLRVTFQPFARKSDCRPNFYQAQVTLRRMYEHDITARRSSCHTVPIIFGFAQEMPVNWGASNYRRRYSYCCAAAIVHPA